MCLKEAITSEEVSSPYEATGNCPLLSSIPEPQLLDVAEVPGTVKELQQPVALSRSGLGRVLAKECKLKLPKQRNRVNYYVHLL